MGNNIKDVTRHIKIEVERELWARAAGRCQFSGHNRILYKSPVTQEQVNIAEKAHIYSFSENGPRGWGPFILNKKEINNISNLMLLCHDCHVLIDEDKQGVKYSAHLLQSWKHEHESRMAIVTGIAPDKKSYVVFYGSNIGEEKSPFDKFEAMATLFPRRYPASENPIALSMSCSHEDRNAGFWLTESSHLKKIFRQKIEPLIEEDQTKHFSIFSLAPIPLLIQLGALFTDKRAVDVYQPIREPKTWSWQEFPEDFEFIIKEPSNKKGQPALIISISDIIAHERVRSILGNDVAIWELTVPREHIGNDCIRAEAQLSMMRSAVRTLMVKVKEIHGNRHLPIFPAMAVSLSIEMGRARMPKADMPWVIYDQNAKEGGFIKALTIGGENGQQQ